MKTRIKKLIPLIFMCIMLVQAMPVKAWVSDNGDGTFTNPVMWGDYPDNDIIRVGDTYYMSSTSMHLFPACPVMSSKDLVNWKYESYALSEEDALRLAKNDDGLTLKNGRHVYDMGPWATSLRYSEKLKKFYLLVNMQDGVDSEYAVLCVADKASGPWKAYRLDNPEGAIKGLYDPGLLFDKDPVTGEENGDVWVIHGQGQLYVSRLNVVDEKTGELAIDDEEKNISLYNYTEGGYNEGSHAYKFGDTYYIISTPTWSGTGTKKSIAIQTKDLVNGPYEVKDIMRSYMNFGENGIHQGGIVDVPQKDGSSEWWSVIFQDRHKLGRVPTLQPVYWEEDGNGLKWPMMGVKGQNGDQAVVTMKKPNTGAETQPQKPADSDEFESKELGLHWQWNHVSDQDKWSLTQRPGYMRLHTATVTNSLTTARNTLRQRVVGPESSAEIKMDISNMQDGDIAGLSVLQRQYNYIGIEKEGKEKRVIISDNGMESISVSIPSDTKEIWFRAYMPRFEYRTEFFYSLDGKKFTRLGGRYDMHAGNYVGMGFGAFNYATKELGGYVDLDYFHMEMPDDHGNYHTLNEKIEAERYDVQSYDSTLGNPSREYNPLTRWTADYTYSDNLTKHGETYDLALTNLRDGNWVTYNRVDFKEGADWLNFRVSGTADGGRIEVRLNDAAGELLANIEVPNTGNLEAFQNVIVPLENSPKNVQKICLVYKEGKPSSCQINWFMAGNMAQPEKPETPQGLQAQGNGRTIELSWNEVSGARGYDLKIGEEIISNVTSPFVKTDLPEGAVYKVSVRAKNYAGYGQWSEGVKASTEGEPYRIPQNMISIPEFSSEEAGGEGPKSGYISAILDGDKDTFWHSAWSSGNAAPPHWFILDLGNAVEVNKITMLPRQGSGDAPNGLIKKFTLSYSNSGTEEDDFTKVLEQKELPQGTALHTIEFEPVTARYLKIYIDESHNNFASLAEIEVFRTKTDDTKPEKPKNVTSKIQWIEDKPALELSWEAAEDKESGIKSYSIFRDGRFIDVTTKLQYVDSSVKEAGVYLYEIVATNGAGLDGEAASLTVNIVTPPRVYRIEKDNMTAIASSEETVDEPNTGHGFAKNILDDNADTFWCTQWSDKNPDGKHPGPHWIVIDLGDVYPLSHAEFVQRNLNTPHGQVTKYNLSYSEDGESYTVFVEDGTWSVSNQSNIVALENIKARYIKLDCLQGQGGYVPAAMAEVNVYAVEEEPEPIVLTEIRIKNPVSKTEYQKGEALDLSGLEIEGVYSDGTTKDIMEYEVSGFDSETSGTKTIIICYEEKTVTFDIRVMEPENPVKPVNKDALKALLDSVKDLDLSKYTEASVAVYKTALARAEEVMANETLSAEDQKIVDKAVKELARAKEQLKLKDTSGGDNKDDEDKDNGSQDNGNKDNGNKDNGNKDNNGSKPKTGDMANPFEMLGFVILSGISILVSLKRKCVK